MIVLQLEPSPLRQAGAACDECCQRPHVWVLAIGGRSLSLCEGCVRELECQVSCRAPMPLAFPPAKAHV